MKNKLLVLFVVITIKFSFSQNASNELIKAKNHFYTGSTFIATGALISYMAISTESKEASIVGITFASIGCIIAFESFSHIGKAGEYLKKNNIALYVNPKGATLCYKF